MPTPLPQKSKISDGVGWPLERRPELSACIARIATFWSRIEERLAQTATHLLGAEPHAGMVRALALDALSKEALHRLDELIVRYREAEWKRDKVVRGHWYVSDDHPHALVWADPADEITEASAFWSGYRPRKVSRTSSVLHETTSGSGRTISCSTRRSSRASSRNSARSASRRRTSISISPKRGPRPPKPKARRARAPRAGCKAAAEARRPRCHQ